MLRSEADGEWHGCSFAEAQEKRRRGCFAVKSNCVCLFTRSNLSTERIGKQRERSCGSVTAGENLASTAEAVVMMSLPSRESKSQALVGKTRKLRQKQPTYFEKILRIVSVLLYWAVAALGPSHFFIGLCKKQNKKEHNKKALPQAAHIKTHGKH